MMASPLPAGRPPRVVLVTCRRWPTLSPSDQRYASALRGMGAQVAAAAWNTGNDQHAFRDADMVVIRASWDYHDEVDAYRAWLHRLEAEGVRVLNDVAMVDRFLDKARFDEFAGADLYLPRSCVCPAQAAAVAQVLSVEGWPRAVLKPVNGASGRGVQLVTRDTVHQAVAAVTADVGARDLLVQEFIPEIADGETQLVLFDGKVSHAVLKRPSAGEFRTNSAFRPDVRLVVPPPDVAARVEAAVRRVAVRPLYARVDIVLRRPAPVLLEFEVNEPGLWLDLAAGAAETFARATMARVRC